MTPSEQAAVAVLLEHVHEWRLENGKGDDYLYCPVCMANSRDDQPKGAFMPLHRPRCEVRAAIEKLEKLAYEVQPPEPPRPPFTKDDILEMRRMNRLAELKALHEAATPDLNILKDKDGYYHVSRGMLRVALFDGIDCQTTTNGGIAARKTDATFLLRIRALLPYLIEDLEYYRDRV